MSIDRLASTRSAEAEEIFGHHELKDWTSRAEVKKIVEEDIEDRNALSTAREKITFRTLALWAALVGVLLASAACVAASIRAGTQQLQDVSGDAIMMSLASFEQTGAGGAPWMQSEAAPAAGNWAHLVL